MKLCILSNEAQREISRICEEAEKRGHTVNVHFPADFRPAAGRCSHLLVRAIRGDVKRAKALAAEALSLGVAVVDRKVAAKRAKTKFYNYRMFRKHGVPTPETVLFNSRSFASLKKLPSEEVVIKPVKGKRGEDLHLCKKKDAAKIVPVLRKGARYMAQEFLPVLKEYRVLVVGRKALGAYYKEALDWRRNLALGANPVAVDLTGELEGIALRAARAVNSEIAGVDILETPRGLFVLEVNRSPGFMGFEAATGINVALEIVKYLEGLGSSKRAGARENKAAGTRKNPGRL